MQRISLSALALSMLLGITGCSGGEGGGEAQLQPTPSQNVPESDPAGVGGTSNQ